MFVGRSNMPLLRDAWLASSCVLNLFECSDVREEMRWGLHIAMGSLVDSEKVRLTAKEDAMTLKMATPVCVGAAEKEQWVGGRGV